MTDTEYFAQFGFAIFDEIQDYNTDTRASVFHRANVRYMLGITAEANNRVDGFDIISRKWVGPILHANQVPGWDTEDINYNGTVEVIEYRGPNEYTEPVQNKKTGMLMASAMVKQFQSDPYRMQLIINKARELYDGGHNFFVFTDLRDFVETIRKALVESGLPVATERETATLMGGASDEAIAKAKRSRIIVATYQYAYKGVSLPKFDAMILASPRRAKIYQTLKRIFRLGGDESVTRRIIDIVDAATALRGQYSDRKAEYTRDVFDFEITKYRLNWDEIDIESENK